MSFDLQRLNMVESQVRPSDVTDRRILRAMLELPRERFVQPSQRSIAYMDQDLCLAAGDRANPGRYLLAPRVLAKLLQLADISAGDHVLDVGCATGYSTALIARLAGTVVGLEVDQALADLAMRTLGQIGIVNAAVVVGPLNQSVPKQGPYDVIVLQGAVPEVPRALLDEIKPDGRLVAVLFEEGLGKATLFRRVGERFDARPAFDAGAPALPGFAQAPAFDF